LELLPPVPDHALVVRFGVVEVVLQRASILLYAVIAVGLNLTVLRDPLLPLTSPMSPAAMVTVMMVMPVILLATLMHEGGHALMFWLQGSRLIRITMGLGGGTCTAVLVEDSPRQLLVRAVAGPTMSLASLGLLLAGQAMTWPVELRTSLLAAIAFMGAVEVVNMLPLHARSDGIVAVHALVWLVRQREPEWFAVLYIWRPLALSVLLLAIAGYAKVGGYLRDGSLATTSVIAGISVLWAVSAAALATRALWRYMTLIWTMRAAEYNGRTPLSRRSPCKPSASLRHPARRALSMGRRVLSHAHTAR